MYLVYFDFVLDAGFLFFIFKSFQINKNIEQGPLLANRFKEINSFQTLRNTQPKIHPIVSLISSYWVRILFFGVKMDQIETIWIFLKPLKQVFVPFTKKVSNPLLRSSLTIAQQNQALTIPKSIPGVQIPREL